MRADPFDEVEFYAAIAASGARALLIGRRAMVALGAPIGTWDYDLWVHPDDVESFNAAVARFDLAPNRTPAEARQRGRYVLENGERVDVLVAQRVSTVDGVQVEFAEVFERAHRFEVAGSAIVPVPTVTDLEAIAERLLTPEEAEAALSAPVDPEERAQQRALIRWFVTAYPTPAARLAYARQAAGRILRPG